MYLKEHRKNFPTDVLVYVEDFDKQKGIVVLDFYDKSEYNIFSTILDDNLQSDKATMIRLTNYFGKTIRENTYYSIKNETFSYLFKSNFLSEIENSYLVGYIIDLSNYNFENEIFTHSVSLNDNSSDSHLMVGRNDVEELNFDLSGELSAVVKNVGQGNWNEILNNGTCIVVYDCGTYMHATKGEIRNLIDLNCTKYSTDKPTLFLSHWDKDHYHCLLGMTDIELSSISNFVVRDYAPTITSERLYDRIRSLISAANVYAIPADDRTARGGSTYLRAMNSITSQLVIYNSQVHKNRNISGILLSLKSAKSSVVFSGDSHYYQVSEFVLPDLNYKHNHTLIVPHHGGKCGNYIYSNPGNLQFDRAIISVGLNSYGHPRANYIESLSNDFKSTSITSAVNNHITINL